MRLCCKYSTFAFEMTVSEMAVSELLRKKFLSGFFMIQRPLIASPTLESEWAVSCF